MPESDMHPDKELVDLLKSCVRKEDFTEWNNWREHHPGKEIHLEGIDFPPNAYLKEVHLEDVHLEGAKLHSARLDKANLCGAYLQRADLTNAHLEGAELEGAHLDDATLLNVSAKGVTLRSASLERANLRGARLQEAKFREANMKDAIFKDARLEGAVLRDVQIEGANFTGARTNGATLLWGCTGSRRTNFSGVGLRGAVVEPELRSYLEGNSRRFMWQRWYKRHSIAKVFIKPFWFISDYGQSTRHIIASFLVLSCLFACIYWLCPGLIANLHEVRVGEEIVQVSPDTVPLRAIYFSVVTMTTLGFGDMHAAYGSPMGHALLMLQVILGYVLLGALVTRMAILFQES